MSRETTAERIARLGRIAGIFGRPPATRNVRRAFDCPETGERCDRDACSVNYHHGWSRPNCDRELTRIGGAAEDGERPVRYGRDRAPEDVPHIRKYGWSND
jgi:hypothetical protein